MSSETPQKANAQGFTILAQYLMQKVCPSSIVISSSLASLPLTRSKASIYLNSILTLVLVFLSHCVASCCLTQKIDQTFIENSLNLLESNPEQVTSNQTLMVLLTYYLLSERNYNKLLLLLNRTRNPEL